jgi:hypothetical protein
VLGRTVTFELDAPTSGTRLFQFSTNVGSPSSFTLSHDGTKTQVYNEIGDGSYQVTLPTTETTGYDVAVLCVGAGSADTTNGQTAFTVAGGAVTCTFTLTGNLRCVCREMSPHNMNIIDEPPTITCPDDIAAFNDAGNCNAIVSYSPTASNSNPGTTTSCDPESDSMFDVDSTTTVTCTINDSSGQTGT